MGLSLIDALIQVESGGDDHAVGDLDLAHKAYGCLQIRQPYVDDVNRVFGSKYKAEDCLGNRPLSIYVFNKYMRIWATEERLGHFPTLEELARMHNGGPYGHKRKSTLAYWEKVKQVLGWTNDATV
jgi:hypothetical protein